MKDEHSNGVDRMFPFGPTCTFNGIEVPTFVTCIKNGSITSQLLTSMLRKMDQLEVFDRSKGVNPFLLCDGHGSRFEGPFLEYVHLGIKPALDLLHWRPIWNIHVASWRQYRTKWDVQN
jgi:hypothetical protein